MCIILKTYQFSSFQYKIIFRNHENLIHWLTISVLLTRIDNYDKGNVNNSKINIKGMYWNSSTNYFSKEDQLPVCKLSHNLGSFFYFIIRNLLHDARKIIINLNFKPIVLVTNSILKIIYLYIKNKTINTYDHRAL